MKINKPHLNTQSLWLMALFWLFLFSLPIAQAADLTFTPQNPVVEVGKKITLSVSGTDGAITWTAAKGFIDGTDFQVTYRSNETGNDVVSVIDEAGNFGSTKIVIVPKEIKPSLENANWEVFTNRSYIQTFILSDDGKTLWVGTGGGLEQYDASTGELVRVFTNLDGLSSNNISVLESNSSGGLWVGTWDGGLIYRSDKGEWTVYRKDSSGLPSNNIKALESDDNGGLWIGTYGLTYLSASGEWTTYTEDNSGLPSNRIEALESDSNGGLWIGTLNTLKGENYIGGGLIYRSASGEWRNVYMTTDNSFNSLLPDNSWLPDNGVTVLKSDGNGGLWIGIGGSERNLVYRSASGEWTVYTKDNSGLPSNRFFALENDRSGGLWIATFPQWNEEENNDIGGGLAYRNINGEWTVYTKDNSGLPSNWVSSFLLDGNGGLWIGTGVPFSEGGLVYRSASGEWRVYTTDNLGLPDNNINTLESDGNKGLWIGTYEGGLAHRSVNGKWIVYTTDNSGLPDNEIRTLKSDDSNGGLWIGTKNDALAYLNVHGENVHGEWTTYTKNHLGLLSNRIEALESDSNGGLWIGTFPQINGEKYVGGGLAYLNASGEWTVDTTETSELPSNWVTALKSDGRGGLWIGTIGGLAYRSASNKWTAYTTNNSELPFNDVSTLLRDSKDGLWIGSGEGLAYRSVSGEWTVYTKRLPINDINALESDDNGGLWIGTGDGLAYHSASDEWTVYTEDNSGLPSNEVFTLESDGSNGLWIGTVFSGLAHLTFSQRNELCTNLTNAQCQTLLESNRAAVLIAGGGTDSTNTLWDTTAGISNQIYKMLNKRGFDNDEIYYLSPQSYADFNGDGFDNGIVDAPATPRNRIQSVDNPIPERPVTVDDVRQAFTWAKTGGHLDYPLYVFFVNHGGTDKFQLADNTYLDVTEFKAILDDYQNETGNQLVLVIDACYSGVLLEKLKAPNRAIISSTGNGLAYFDRGNKQGFSRFFSEGLLYGMSFHEAFGYATDKQNRLVRSLNIGQDQVPQFYDAQEGAWLKEIFINGDFTVGDLTLNVEALTTATTLTAGQPLNLQAKVTLAQGNIKRVWAILKPPKVNLVMDSNGTPILAFPSFNLYRTDNEDIWDTTWQDAVYNGEHEIVFYAKDNQGNIANSEPVIITVNGGTDSPDQSKVQLVLEKNSYQAGETFKAELIEDLGWGYDLYAAVVFPDSNFLALKKTNDLAKVNQAKQWFGQRAQHQPVTLFELTLPSDLPTGEYCIYGILSPEREDVFETMAQGLSVVEVQCVNILGAD